MDWQPIETAPKDGTAILICRNRPLGPCGMRVSYFDGDDDADYPWHADDGADGFNHHKDWPTHWMPLPAPPA